MNQVPYAFFSQEKENAYKASQQQDGPFVLSYEGQYSFEVFKKNNDWNQDEKAKYVFLIQYQKSRMEKKEHKKLWEVYKYMAKLIGSRNYIQCKLYHQKMLKKYESIDKIIFCLTREDQEVEKKVQNLREKLIKFKRSKECQKQAVIAAEIASTDDFYFQQFKEQSNYSHLSSKEHYKEDTMDSCERRAQFFRNICLPPLC